ncbi:MAG: hypothetical protein N3A60_05805, partial [Thermanaerothrix sp.]|nr:hypothetical protein [Thermanaerothrix sp.]
MVLNPSPTPPFTPWDTTEHDACALYMSVRKHGQSTFGTLKRALGALISMGHRTGFVNGEGDGAGVQTDIPRRLWARKLAQAGLPSYLATQPGFWVGHLFAPPGFSDAELRALVAAHFDRAGLNPLYLEPGRVRPEALGAQARQNPPQFWQIAGHVSGSEELEKRLLEVQAELERTHAFHFASLSPHTVVYKVRGSVEVLAQYYPDLRDRYFDTSAVMCHARYSTNTVSTFERAQPFALLGHNGEINTIQRLRQEAAQLGVPLVNGASDSQDVDRLLHTLCAWYHLDLVEAMEMVFPPSPHEINLLPPEDRAIYQMLRRALGPYAQGPAAVVARWGAWVVASVDALGLRPLWWVETEKEYIFTSERGAIPMETWVNEPRALAPGEKVALLLRRGEDALVLDHAQIRRHVITRATQHHPSTAITDAGMDWGPWTEAASPLASFNRAGGQTEVLVRPATFSLPLSRPSAVPFKPAWQEQPAPLPTPTSCSPINSRLLSANGWLRDHLNEVAALASEQKDDLISSLGYDGPLAALSRARVNLADFFKEAVAVVTNPSIDHAREGEVFSTEVLVGARPPVDRASPEGDVLIELGLPILTGGHPGLYSEEVAERVAHHFGTLTFEALVSAFGTRATRLPLGVRPDETVATALERLSRAAVAAVQAGQQCLILDDLAAHEDGLNWLDPHLAISALDRALRHAPPGPEGNLRRRTGIVVRSAALRNLHDLALACGLGADAVVPYALFAVALKSEGDVVEDALAEPLLMRVIENLQEGLEKVTSTMGCHELRGYGRVFGAIGLAPSLAEVFEAPNY